MQPIKGKNFKMWSLDSLPRKVRFRPMVLNRGPFRVASGTSRLEGKQKSLKPGLLHRTHYLHFGRNSNGLREVCRGLHLR